MKKDSLGDRMKNNYENRAKTFLARRTPVIVRLDGKAFHTFTKGFAKPYDKLFMKTMQETAKMLCENIQGCKFAYTQSDEISLLLTDYDKLNTDAYFDYSVQKICSVSASMATLYFNSIFRELIYNLSGEDLENILYMNKIDKALFDCRCFNIPKEEVCNYFIWRQQDSIRNAISSLGQQYYSQRELNGKNSAMIEEMLVAEHNVDFDDDELNLFKRGSCCTKFDSGWEIEYELPTFSKQREFIECLIFDLSKGE